MFSKEISIDAAHLLGFPQTKHRMALKWYCARGSLLYSYPSGAEAVCIVILVRESDIEVF